MTDANFADRLTKVERDQSFPNLKPRDPVARFHLSNGASVHRLNWLGDRSRNGMKQSAGVMVNYLYRLDDIDQNHERFVRDGAVASSSEVRRLADL